MIPQKLKKGDEVRIIAPSKSMNVLTKEQITLAKKKLEELGFVVTYAKHVYECDDIYESSSIEARLEDLHEAFLDKNVKCIIAARGGYNSNQLLDYIDYNIIKNNPKILCGFSDITALLNAIYKKTGIITFCGPVYSSFAMKLGFDYTLNYFKKIVFENNPIEVLSSEKYSDDKWYKDQINRNFINNEGMKIINEGVCDGIIVGGNLCTLNLLQGTEYMPSLENSILFIEDDEETGDNFLNEFDRNLESLTQLPDFKGVKGIVIGRAQISSNMTYEKWEVMLKNKQKLKDIPIIINVDFGHTTPLITFPIGGKCHIEAKDSRVKLIIEK